MILRAVKIFQLALAALLLVPTSGEAHAFCPYTIYFDSGSAALTSQTRDILENVLGEAEGIQPPSMISIAGHTDSVGDAEANLRLSRRRAEAVRAYFISRGVPPAVVLLESFGETRPVVEVPDGTAQPQNRRVEIIGYDPSAPPLPPGAVWC